MRLAGRFLFAMQSPKTVLIIGINGFIGHHLLGRILTDTAWNILGVDIGDDRVQKHLGHERFVFHKADMTEERDLIESLVKQSDVVLPLAAVATPQLYMTQPLRVFELDFEENLPIVRHCVKYGKRVIFPSTSEVYGMSRDSEFHPDHSQLVVGPISKVRWIYSTSKQLMDRIIWAYGRDHGLDFTLFRPFNWMGVGLDSLETGQSRVITKFLGNILRGEDLLLVDGGIQRRSFTDIEDSIDALLKIIENKDSIATGKIYNIGNPSNNHSIRELAEMLYEMAPSYPFFKENVHKVKIVDIASQAHYGEGYQDVQNRTPYIENTRKDLNWNPKISMRESLKRTYEEHAKQLKKKGEKS
ncbi:MAG: bifunctional UDP-4-keto-pentose/UDP-xylose synthase [Patescibacteria group bacterium]